MKVQLVVATGVHQGKVIPVPVAQFVIGRDPSCQLRPASQAISKQHCAILTRDGKVYVKDYGSTNGTFLNEVQVPANSETELTSEDRLRVGPLDFTLKISVTGVSDSTPLPEAMKKMSSSTMEKLRTAGGSKAATPAAPKPTPVPKPKATETPDDIAAMLLGMDEDTPGSTPTVPEGSTIMEMPAVIAGETKPADKKASVPTREDTSNAASDILKRYMRRPR
jgi:predicted component of type VI protein secretion system